MCDSPLIFSFEKIGAHVKENHNLSLEDYEINYSAFECTDKKGKPDAYCDDSQFTVAKVFERSLANYLQNLTSKWFLLSLLHILLKMYLPIENKKWTLHIAMFFHVFNILRKHHYKLCHVILSREQKRICNAMTVVNASFELFVDK